MLINLTPSPILPRRAGDGVRSNSRRQVARVVALVSCGLALNACSAPPRGEATGQTTSAIEGGKPINDPSDPLSTTFALSTVDVAHGCTGTLLTATKVLTAAHCGISAGALVWLYPTTPGGGATPTSTSIAVTAVATPPGVSCTGNDPDPTCWSTSGSGRHYADLAVLTLASAVPSPYKPALLQPGLDWFEQMLSHLYAVGRGKIDYSTVDCDPRRITSVIANASSQMMWVPAPAGFFDTVDTSGKVLTFHVVADQGDSGGPLYRKAAGSPLTIMGVLSYGDCASDAGSAADTYTNVLQKDNHDWLVAQGATVAPSADFTGEKEWPPASDAPAWPGETEKVVDVPNR